MLGAMRALRLLFAALLTVWVAGCGGASTGSSSGTSSGGGTSGSTAASSSTGSSASSGSATSGSSTSSSSSSGATSSGSGSGGGSTSGASNLWVTGYYVGWESQAYPVAEVDFAAMTHVVIGPVLPNPDGSLDTTFSIDATHGPQWAQSASQAARAAGDHVLLWVGGADSASAFEGATSPGHLAAFVQNLIAAMSAYGAEGVDLDWEPISSNDEAAFTSLLEALRQAAPDATLTIPVGALNLNIDEVDAFYVTASGLVDQMNIMSYGVSGAWPGWQSWHSSPLSGETGSTPVSIESSVQAYLAAGVPASKLGIGVGFYGLCYTPPVTGPNQALGGSTIVASDGDMSYANIMSSYYDVSAARWDATAEAPYLSFASGTGPAGCSFISYDDAQSIAAKAQYVKANGLGGTIVWEIAEGYLASQPAGQRDPLMEALRTSFRQ